MFDIFSLNFKHILLRLFDLQFKIFMIKIKIMYVKTELSAFETKIASCPFLIRRFVEVSRKQYKQYKQTENNFTTPT